MPTHLPGRYVAAALLLGGLACAGNKAPNENAEMAKDTTQIQDSAAYKAMERDTTANTSKSSGIEHADTNQGSAPNSTSQNPPTQMSTDSAASSGFVRADTNQATAPDSATQSPPSPNSQGGWSTDTAGMKSDSSANTPN